MHPLLARARNLGIYLLAWFPLGAMLAYLLKTSGGLDSGRGCDAYLSPVPGVCICLPGGLVSVSSDATGGFGFSPAGGDTFAGCCIGQHVVDGNGEGGGRGIGKARISESRCSLGTTPFVAVDHGNSALPVVGNISLRATGGAELTRGAGTSLGGTSAGARC